MTPTSLEPRIDSPLVDVTVVIPAMNRAHTIARALKSVAEQTVRPKSVIVIDDASTDETVAVARGHGARVIAFGTNQGSGPARNAGIQAAQTTWVAFLDSDDAWLPDHLATLVQAIGAHALVAAPGRNDRGRLIGNSSGRNMIVSAKTALVPGDLICTSGVLARCQSLIDAGMFRPLRRAQDLDMWLRTLELGSGMVLGEPGFVYYVHDGQAILDTTLTRDCYGQIVDWSCTRPWFSKRDADRAWARWHWDGLRSAHRAHNGPHIADEVLWFARRPHTWATMVAKLAERKRSRR